MNTEQSDSHVKMGWNLEVWKWMGKGEDEDIDCHSGDTEWDPFQGMQTMVRCMGIYVDIEDLTMMIEDEAIG